MGVEVTDSLPPLPLFFTSTTGSGKVWREHNHDEVVWANNSAQMRKTERAFNVINPRTTSS